MTEKREIKFRAWDPYDNKWAYFTIGQSFGTRGDYIYKSICLEGKEFHQFTGKILKGVEVFDGDIIEFDRKEWGDDDNRFLVEWDYDDCAWSFGGGGGKSDDEFRTVIGNKTQNPELLTP